MVLRGTNVQLNRGDLVALMKDGTSLELRTVSHVVPNRGAENTVVSFAEQENEPC